MHLAAEGDGTSAGSAIGRRVDRTGQCPTRYASSHVAAFAEARAERVLFTLPNAGADKVLPVLDKLAKLHA